MRTPNTSKPFGGVVIKLKTKQPILRLIRVCLILLFTFFCCMGLLYLFDTVFNGTIMDWISNRYFTSYSYEYALDQETYVIEPNWSAIKSLVFSLFIFITLFWVATVILTSYIQSKRSMRTQTAHISHLIEQIMDDEIPDLSLIPKEYAQISAQMVQIKAASQRHEQLLKDEAARKNDLITYLAHDLKTPLTSVLGYLSLLDEAPDMPVEQKAKYVHIALSKAYRLEELINEFFDITRYNLQQIVLEKETINLDYMLMQMADEFYPLLTAHGNTIQLDVAEDLTVLGDSVKLARVFNNILKNAISYSYPSTPIRLSAHMANGVISIDFQNHGTTIPPHKLTAIFEKFFRLDEARSSNTGGSGLGLAIAKEIVTLHGGSISAASQNEITTFHISLPVSS